MTDEGGTTGTKIRQATLADLPSIVEIEQASFDDPYTPGYLEMLLRFDQGTFLVAEMDGNVIGYVVATCRGRTGHILSIAVIREQRRRGVAKELMKRLVDELSVRGVSRARLEVKRGNPAMGFYLALGFRQVGVIRAYYNDSSDAITMEMELE